MSKDFYKTFTKEDTYYIALMLLYFLKDEKKYSTVSEMVYLLDKDNFLSLVQYYGGQEVYIPESEEIITALKTILLYQYRVINKLSWEKALKKAGFAPSESANARGLYVTLEKVLKKTKIGTDFIKFIGESQ